MNQNDKTHQSESEFDLYIKSRNKIDQDLEYNSNIYSFFFFSSFFFSSINRDLEISVEELQNDVKTKHCFVTINDVESFALILSTISRLLVDLKASFPLLREKLSSSDQQSIIQ